LSNVAGRHSQAFGNADRVKPSPETEEEHGCNHGGWALLSQARIKHFYLWFKPFISWVARALQSYVTRAKFL
jgi:hypothetical protein